MGEYVRVNGTLIWYYAICPRQVWLMSRHILPDENKDSIVLGRWIHQHSYSRDRHEVLLDNIKIDVMQGKKGQVLIGEIKKSSRAEASARMQLKFYLYELKMRYGLDLKGVLLFPEEKKREEVVLDQSGIEEIERAIDDIKKIQQMDLPPVPVKTKWCRPCAYAEFCWS